MVVIVLMGVCGSGKSTVGEALREKLKCSLRDADDFHSEANKDKMRNRIPLTDEDRLPWLLNIHSHIKRLSECKEMGIVTCSALKKSYRKTLLAGMDDKPSPQLTDVVFVFLSGEYDVLLERLNQRKGHFMPASLLISQLETLEEPHESENINLVKVNICDAESIVIKNILNSLKKWI